MNTTLIAKSSLNKEQLAHRAALGFMCIEVQLLDDFMNKSIEELVGVAESVQGLHYASVHTPLGKTAFNLEDFTSRDVKKLFRKACEFASILGAKQDCIMDVVLHSEFSNSDFERFPEVKKQCFFEVLQVLNRFPNINICIENLVPLFTEKNGDIYMSNNYFNQSIEFAKELNEYFESPRVFTVLDTCHMLATMNFFKMLNLNHLFNRSIDDYFKANEGVANIIHLCNAKGLALDDDHGLPFNINVKDDMFVLNQIIKSWSQYTPNAKLVLEVIEEDYMDCKNLVETKKAIEVIFNKLNIG